MLFTAYGMIQKIIANWEVQLLFEKADAYIIKNQFHPIDETTF